ncbi:hypothetical protein PVE_R2G0213 [Pseudomonas veronii 1YdBTEX2]|uniref:Uncharacterized protein n=1 Tax=Pseudomonas veronii 1YdBTEX2 TaxID=1295141 RepID=A0A1D3K7J0_PSEVE|nr:hypothetical protein PVE_R2G0213 [Pseudomonas veronii 1YdBTEX2]
MKALMKAIIRVDAALDLFWIGIVLRTYHEAQAARFSRLAERLALAAVEHQRIDYVSHQALRHKLEADLLLGKV